MRIMLESRDELIGWRIFKEIQLIRIRTKKLNRELLTLNPRNTQVNFILLLLNKYFDWSISTRHLYLYNNNLPSVNIISRDGCVGRFDPRPNHLRGRQWKTERQHRSCITRFRKEIIADTTTGRAQLPYSRSFCVQDPHQVFKTSSSRRCPREREIWPSSHH